jgi:hypothetical protein
MYSIVVMSATLGDLNRWESLLTALDGKACGFAHHDGEMDKPNPLCPAHIQNKTHGCAHAVRYALTEVIHEMKSMGALERNEAEDLYIEIHKGGQILIQDLDFEYSLNPFTDTQHAEMVLKQKEIIGSRMKIADHVLQKIRELKIAHGGLISLPVV